MPSKRVILPGIFEFWLPARPKNILIGQTRTKYQYPALIQDLPQENTSLPK